MEGEWHIQLGSLEALGGKGLVGSTNNLAATAENGLLWTVDASNLGHLVSKSGADSISAALDGEHAVCVGSALLL